MMLAHVTHTAAAGLDDQLSVSLDRPESGAVNALAMPVRGRVSSRGPRPRVLAFMAADRVVHRAGLQPGPGEGLWTFDTQLDVSAVGAMLDMAVTGGSAPRLVGHLHIRRAWRRASHPAERDVVSVVIPCFNQAHFLADAINSAINQTYPHVEIVVVDDGSTDETAGVAAGFGGRVRYVHQPNAGLSAARNTGIRSSHGEYLVFLDADDRLVPDALTTNRAALYAHPEWAFVSGEHRYIDTAGAVLREWSGPRVSGDHYAALLRKNYVGCPAAVMYRRAVFTVEPAFDETSRACEDYDLYLRIARRYPVGAHDTLVAEYRRYHRSMSTNTALMLSSALSVLRAHAAHVKGNAALERALRDGIRFWREYYGRPLAWHTREQWRTPGKRWGAISALLSLLRLAPQEVAHPSRPEFQ